MKLVVIESPLAGNRRRNKAYARACMLDALGRGEAPYASHLLFDQLGLLDDDVPEQRQAGIAAGLAWGTKAELRAVYVDLGVSSGMRRGIEEAARVGQPIEYRTLAEGWDRHEGA